MRLFNRPVARPILPRPARPPADERPPGCGWFDSSHELQRGLRVTEIDEPRDAAPILPLSWWLAWELDAVLPSVR